MDPMRAADCTSQVEVPVVGVPVVKTNHARTRGTGTQLTQAAEAKQGIRAPISAPGNVANGAK